MKAPVRRLALFAAALVAANVSCGREITGPDVARYSGPLSFAAEYPAALRLSGSRLSSLVAFERVRILVRRSSGEVAYDRTIDFPAGADSIPMALNVPIAANAPVDGEPMTLTLLYVNIAGDTVFTGGPVAVLVTPARPGDPPPAAIPVPLRYTGPGEEAVRVEISPPTATLVANGAALQFTAQAFDEFDTPLQTSAVVFESSDTTMLTINATGLATALPKRGAVLVIARLYNDGTQGDTAEVTVALPASSLALESGDAQTGVAGAPLAQNVVVRALAADAVPVAGVAVTFAAANGGSPTSAVVNTDALGYASAAWTLGPGAGAQTLTATAAGLSGSPVTFAATAIGGAPTSLAVTTQPSAVIAGEAIAPAVVVEARTAGGQLASGYTGDVTIAIASNPGNGILSGTLTVAAVNGVATFSTLSIDRAAAGYSLVASAAGLTNAVSGNFIVTAAAAASLVWVVQPVGGTPGVALTPPPAVGALDAFGNAASFAGTVTIALDANPGAATLSGTTSVAAIAGFATFAGISLDNLGVGYTLEASAAGLGSAVSDPFTIGAQIIVWTNAAGGSWRTPANWNLGRIPTAADVVEISLAGTYTVVLDTSVTVATLNIGGASGTQTLEMTSQTLSVADQVDVRSNGVFRPTSSTITGPGSVHVSEGAMLLASSALSASLLNSSLVVASGHSQFTGSVSNAPGATLRIAQFEGCCGTAWLTVANGFTNAGLIELSNQLPDARSVVLSVTNGTLVNAVGATIAVMAGQTPGGSRTLEAQLHNQGTLDIAVPLLMNRGSSAHVNTGMIAVAADLTIVQSGLEPSFTNTATITIGSGRTLSVQNGAFNQAAGTVGGSGTLSLLNLTAAFTTDFSNETTTLALTGSTINGPGTLTNATGRTLTLLTSTVNLPVVNDGVLVASGSSAINGTFSNPAGSTLRVAQADGCCGTAWLTVANGFTNAGLIELSNQLPDARSVVLSVTNGTLVNAVGATITALDGTAPGGTRTLEAQLNNEGTLELEVPLVMNRPNSVHSNSGTIDVTVANLSIVQSGAGASFTNTGTISIGAGRTLTVNNGTFNQAAGTLEGPGTLSLGNLTAAFTTDFSNATIGLSVLGSTLNGPGTLTNATGRTLALFSVTVNATLMNDGLVIASGTSAINGTFSNPAGSTLRVAQFDGCCGTAMLTMMNGFTNEGLIELSNQFPFAFSAQLTVTNGTLVNAPGATIAVLGGQTPGGTRTLMAQLDNQGMLQLGVPLLINSASSAHVNTGTIDVTVANLNIVQSGAGASFTNTGTISIGTGRTLTVQNGAFNQAAGTLGGPGTLSLVNLTATFTTDFSNATTTLAVSNSTINGPGTLTNATGRTLALFSVTVNAALMNDGLVIASGTSAFNGTFSNPAGSTLRVAQFDGCCGTATLTVANGFTNEGLIELSNQITAAYGAQLTVTSGTLVNAPGATIAVLGGQTPGGSRTLMAELDNQGSLDIAVPLLMNSASSAHVNTGTIDVTAANLSIAQSGAGASFTNTGTISIGSGRTLTVQNGAFNQTAGTLGGPGTLSLVNLTATFTTDFSNATTGLAVSNSTINGPGTLTNATGRTLVLLSVTVNAPLMNDGLVIASGTSAFNGTFSNPAGSTLRVAQFDGCCGTATLTVANGFTNEGLIELSNQITAAYGAQLTVTSGTLVNAVDATIAVLGGQTPGGTRTLAAQLDNQGALQVSVPLLMNRPSSNHVNSGSITLDGGNLTIAQSVTAPSFANQGAITIGAGRTFTVSGGSFTTELGATIDGGTLAFNNTNAAFNDVVPDVDALSFNSSNVTLVGALNAATTPLTVVSSVFNGAQTLTNPAGSTLTLLGATVNMPLVNEGLLIASGTSAFSATFTNAPSATLRVAQADGCCGTAVLTVANGFTNQGLIEITNQFVAAYGAQLMVTNGTLLNAPGATISALGGQTPGGTRTLTAQLDNQGALNVDVALSLNYSGADHLNSGIITLAGGDLTISQGGTTPSTVNSGIITIGAGRTLQVNGGSFTNTALGSISGATFAAGNATVAFQGATPSVASMVLSSSPTSFEQSVSNASTEFTLVNSQLSGTEPFTNVAGQSLTLRSASINMPLDNQGTLIASGTSSVLGSLSTALGSVIRVGQVDGSSGLANLTVANGFANSGTIEITNSFPAGYNSLLSISAGELLNTANGVILSSNGTTGGGTRGITVQGAFTNQGTLTVHPGAAGRLSISTTGGFQNSGTINIELGGMSQGATYDWLALVGPVMLGGTLNIGLVNAFMPSSGNAFTPITFAGSVSGTFATIVPPGGVILNPNYGPSAVTFVVP